MNNIDGFNATDRPRVFVFSVAGYGYGETVREAKDNHDRATLVHRPITIKARPEDEKWLENGFGDILHPNQTITFEDTASASDVYRFVERQVESSVSALVDYAIVSDRVDSEDELTAYIDGEAIGTIENVLTALSLDNLLVLATEHSQDIISENVHTGRFGDTLPSILARLLASVLQPWLMYAVDRGKEEGIYGLLESYGLNPTVLDDRVELIVKEMDGEDEEE